MIDFRLCLNKTSNAISRDWESQVLLGRCTRIFLPVREKQQLAAFEIREHGYFRTDFGMLRDLKISRTHTTFSHFSIHFFSKSLRNLPFRMIDSMNFSSKAVNIPGGWFRPSRLKCFAKVLKAELAKTLPLMTTRVYVNAHRQICLILR